jgi:Flp pilus assembly protein TadG
MELSVKSRQSAQGIVEFALVIPLFLSLVLLTFEAGRMMYVWAVLNEATREATRTAVLSSSVRTDPIVQSALNLAGTVGVSASDVTIKQNGNPVSGAIVREKGDAMSVSISYRYQVFIAAVMRPDLASLPFTSLQWTIQTTMRSEG